MELRIAQVVERTEAEGPGERFAIWVQGCPIQCEGCCNPEMHPLEGGEVVDTGELAERIFAVEGLEGITLLGGEPFAQAGACADLAQRVRLRGLTVMVFSGYVLGGDLEPTVEACSLLAWTDVLVDGPYRVKSPEKHRRWIGSRNQRMHFLSSAYDPRDQRLLEGNTLEIRYRDGEVAVNGWPSLDIRSSDNG